MMSKTTKEGPLIQAQKKQTARMIRFGKTVELLQSTTQTELYEQETFSKTKVHLATSAQALNEQLQHKHLKKKSL